MIWTDCHSRLRWNFHLQWIRQVQRCTILMQEIVSWEFTAGFCHMKNSDLYLVDPQHHLLLFLAEVSMVGKYFLMEEHSLNNPPSDFDMAANFFSPSEWISKIVIVWSSLIDQHCQKCFGLHIAYNTTYKLSQYPHVGKPHCWCDQHLHNHPKYH